MIIVDLTAIIIAALVIWMLVRIFGQESRKSLLRKANATVAWQTTLIDNIRRDALAAQNTEPTLSDIILSRISKAERKQVEA
jgi:hypothetical protein